MCFPLTLLVYRGEAFSFRDPTPIQIADGSSGMHHASGSYSVVIKNESGIVHGPRVDHPVIAPLEPAVVGRSACHRGRGNREKHGREGVPVVCSRLLRMLPHPERAHQ